MSVLTAENDTVPAAARAEIVVTMVSDAEAVLALVHDTCASLAPEAVAPSLSLGLKDVHLAVDAAGDGALPTGG